MGDLPDWLEEFTENLEVEGVLASRDTPASTSQLCQILAHSRFFKDYAYRQLRFPCKRRGRTQNTSSHAHFSQSCSCSALDSTLHTYIRACGSSQARDMVGKCCIPARLLESPPISQHVSQTAPRQCLTHFHQFVPRHRRRHLVRCC